MKSHYQYQDAIAATVARIDTLMRERGLVLDALAVIPEDRRMAMQDELRRVGAELLAAAGALTNLSMAAQFEVVPAPEKGTPA